MDEEKIEQTITMPKKKSMAVPIILVVVILVVGFMLVRRNTMQLPESEKTVGVSEAVKDEVGARVIEVNGNNFSFAPSEIRVKKDEKIKIVFKNTGGVHDFVIDEFNARTDSIKGGTETSVVFVADKAGSFEYYCSIGQHRLMGMKGTLVVE